MKAIYKGNNFSIVWNITDRSTAQPFDFTGLNVEVGLYSDSCKTILQSYTIENGTITAQIEANRLPIGVYHLMCRYAGKNEQAYCTSRNAFQITARPNLGTDVEIITLNSTASHIDSTPEDIPQPHECELTAEELWQTYFRLPELTADRAISDEMGNRITDTYVTREAVTKHIRNTYNQAFLENPPLVTDGYITPQMLSEETRELLENTGQEIHNLPDGEDLQSVHGVLKLANKQHNPNSYSGLGRQYLRKNIVAGVNVLTQSMLQWPNTIYIIQYDYDLQGAEITIPEGCVLDFQGGSLSNGTLRLNKTNIKGSKCFKIGTKITGELISDKIKARWVDSIILSEILNVFNNMIRKEYLINERIETTIILDSGLYEITEETFIGNLIIKGSGKYSTYLYISNGQLYSTSHFMNCIRDLSICMNINNVFESAIFINSRQSNESISRYTGIFHNISFVSCNNSNIINKDYKSPNYIGIKSTKKAIDIITNNGIYPLDFQNITINGYDKGIHIRGTEDNSWVTALNMYNILINSCHTGIDVADVISSAFSNIYIVMSNLYSEFKDTTAIKFTHSSRNSITGLVTFSDITESKCYAIYEVNSHHNMYYGGQVEGELYSDNNFKGNIMKFSWVDRFAGLNLTRTQWLPNYNTDVKPIPSPFTNIKTLNYTNGHCIYSIKAEDILNIDVTDLYNKHGNLTLTFLYNSDKETENIYFKYIIDVVYYKEDNSIIEDYKFIESGSIKHIKNIASVKKKDEPISKVIISLRNKDTNSNTIFNLFMDTFNFYIGNVVGEEENANAYFLYNNYEGIENYPLKHICQKYITNKTDLKTILIEGEDIYGNYCLFSIERLSDLNVNVKVNDINIASETTIYNYHLEELLSKVYSIKGYDKEYSSMIDDENISAKNYNQITINDIEPICEVVIGKNFIKDSDNSYTTWAKTGVLRDDINKKIKYGSEKLRSNDWSYPYYISSDSYQLLINNVGVKSFPKKFSSRIVEGTSEKRPNLESTDRSFIYFDTTLNKPIWWTGEKWVDATGTEV